MFIPAPPYFGEDYEPTIDSEYIREQREEYPVLLANYQSNHEKAIDKVALLKKQLAEAEAVVREWEGIRKEAIETGESYMDRNPCY